MFNEHPYYRDVPTMFYLLEGRPRRNMSTVDKMSTVVNELKTDVVY